MSGRLPPGRRTTCKELQFRRSCGGRLWSDAHQRTRERVAKRCHADYDVLGLLRTRRELSFIRNTENSSGSGLPKTSPKSSRGTTRPATELTRTGPMHSSRSRTGSPRARRPTPIAIFMRVRWPGNVHRQYRRRLGRSDQSACVAAYVHVIVDEVRERLARIGLPAHELETRGAKQILE